MVNTSYKTSAKLYIIGYNKRTQTCNKECVIYYLLMTHYICIFTIKSSFLVLHSCVYVVNFALTVDYACSMLAKGNDILPVNRICSLNLLNIPDTLLYR